MLNFKAIAAQESLDGERAAAVARKRTAADKVVSLKLLLSQSRDSLKRAEDAVTLHTKQIADLTASLRTAERDLARLA